MPAFRSLVLVLTLLAPTLASAGTTPVINELVAKGTEFVEIYNPGPAGGGLGGGDRGGAQCGAG
ncbi:MAG: hypothetical protein AAGD38_18155, partial [Acidobacteriota bacterium]